MTAVSLKVGAGIGQRVISQCLLQLKLAEALSFSCFSLHIFESREHLNTPWIGFQGFSLPGFKKEALELYEDVLKQQAAGNQTALRHVSTHATRMLSGLLAKTHCNPSFLQSSDFWT